MADPVTAHGWTVYPDCITHVASHLTTTNQLGRPGPRAGLARCIEDAATLAKVRDVLTRWEADVDADDTATLDRLLALLSEGRPPMADLPEIHQDHELDAWGLEAVRLAQLADDLTDACPAHPEDPALLVDTCPYCRLLVHLLGATS